LKRYYIWEYRNKEKFKTIDIGDRVNPRTGLVAVE
jgi:hypothetical protein